MKKPITSTWIYCFLVATVLSALAHNSNWFAPIHEYGHFLVYEEQGLVVSTHWSHIMVEHSTPRGLLAGFKFEVMIFCAIGFIAILNKWSILLGWSIGCMFSVYGYARHSTDFDTFSRMYNVPMSVLYDDWDRYYFIVLGFTLGIAYIVYYLRNKKYS